MRIPRIAAFAALCLALGLCASSVSAQTPPSEPILRRVLPPYAALPLRSLAPVRGGTNYLWYRVDADCTREPYGIVANYADSSVRALVQQQLAAMRAAGMARINLGVHFAHGQRTGTLIDSSDPAQVAQTAANVAQLLADARAAGFREVLFRFFPAGAISPEDRAYPDPESDPSLVREHLNLIATIRPALVNAQLPYLIDLSVEAAPRDSDLPFIPDPWKYPANTNWSHGVRMLWQLYYAAYGSDDTIGYSFITDADPDRMRARVRHMRYAYDIGGGVPRYPHIFALDIYGDAVTSEATRFVQFDGAMKSEDASGALGWKGASVIVAETYYDDPVAAENISSAMHSTGRRVYFLMQWPWDRGANAASCGATTGVNVAPPFTWNTYAYYGF